MWSWAIMAGVLGFWAVSLIVQIRYPLNPPGVGEESSLLMRQAFQFLFVIISLVSVCGVCVGLKLKSLPHQQRAFFTYARRIEWITDLNY
jgi:hypothetical protein